MGIQPGAIWIVALKGSEAEAKTMMDSGMVHLELHASGCR